jgi:ABC-2 type transport system ATP-binding protein
VTATADIVLRATGLIKRFGPLVAVDGLSFEVRRGEVLGFLGPNGAGKTTTLAMLCGLLAPDAGSIEIDGHRLLAGKNAGTRRIGVAPQAIVIWESLTCREQLELMGRLYDLSPGAARLRAGELLTAFGLEEKRDALGRTLSGGMQRRLNIALGLVHEPTLVFLDEPQAGLDPQSRVLVREYVRALAGRATVVVTTHDMEEAEKLSHRVCVVDHGKLLALDTVEAIKGRLGEGDVFEIDLAAGEGADLLPMLEGVVPDHPAPSIQGDRLSFTASRGAELLPAVLRRIGERGLHLKGLRVRPRTLEDVFIRLTGRGLRE